MTEGSAEGRGMDASRQSYVYLPDCPNMRLMTTDALTPLRNDPTRKSRKSGKGKFSALSRERM